MDLTEPTPNCCGRNTAGDASGQEVCLVGGAVRLKWLLVPCTELDCIRGN